MKRAEQSATRAKRQASGTEQFVLGVGLKDLNAEISADRPKGAKCQRTEQSVDRHGEPSVERGAIRERRKGQGVESGAIRERHNAKVSSAEQSAGGPEF